MKSASHRGVSLCYCRRKMGHVKERCDAPLDICMTLNSAAESLIRHGHAREVDVVEGLELLQEAYENNLVQFGDNIREKVSFICNCCGCCCEAMLAAQKYAFLEPVHTTNFIPEVTLENCTGCGKCVSACPVAGMVLTSANDPAKKTKKVAKVDEERCLGCGVCVRVCEREGAIELNSRKERVITPLNGAHRAALMAIERGKLQNLVFDNRILWSHRALGALFGVILKLPPVKMAMATKQFRSVYLENIAKNY